MAERLTRPQIAEKAIVHAAPALRAPTTVDRNFELPTALYALTALGYLSFLGLTALAFGNPGLILPMAIFVTFIAMFFGVPAMWVRMKPANPQTPLGWGRFLASGIRTYTGPVTAGQASVQVLILPALILVWGFAVVTIAALVR
jgi:hypothetical protein